VLFAEREGSVRERERERERARERERERETSFQPIRRESVLAFEIKVSY
jgi:hypothetical protein